MLTLLATPEQALTTPGELRAGGTDVTARRRQRVSVGAVADLSLLTAYRAIEWGPDNAATIGALVTIAAVADDPRVQQHYPGLAQAAGGLANPQIRAMASMGGSLLQRTRCTYFRNPAFTCFKKGGTDCPSRTGHHALGVVFDLSPCVYPHPSTLGMALMAYEAQVAVLGGGSLSVADLFGDGTDPTRDHMLNSGELLTHIVLPPPLPGEKSAYLRSISRFEAEWPLVEVIVRLALQADNVITFARVAVGGVATVPLRLQNVEAALIGQKATDATFAQAAALATEGAKPLPQTGYKLQLLPRTLLEGLERALSGGGH